MKIFSICMLLIIIIQLFVYLRRSKKISNDIVKLLSETEKKHFGDPFDGELNENENHKLYFGPEYDPPGLPVKKMIHKNESVNKLKVREKWLLKTDDYETKNQIDIGKKDEKNE